MTAAEFNAALVTLGLADPARALGVTPRAIRHWRTGQRPVNPTVALHLRDLLVLKGLGLLDVLPSLAA